jgi:hypothetical protein
VRAVAYEAYRAGIEEGLGELQDQMGDIMEPLYGPDGDLRGYRLHIGEADLAEGHAATAGPTSAYSVDSPLAST